MNKFATAALVVAVGAGGYWLAAENSPEMASDPILAYIPADTLAFSAQFSPFPIKDYLYSAASTQQYGPLEELELAFADSSPQERFFLSFFKAYVERAQDPERLLADLGLGDTLKSYFYTLGALPVFKFDIQNSAAFWAYFDALEQESGLKHKLNTVAGADYRAYVLTDVDDEEQLELIIAERDAWVTITINSSVNDSELLEMALGLKAVDKPISETTMIEDMIHEHGFTSDGLGFINHVELVKAITSSDANMLAKQLTSLAAIIGEDPFDELKTANCQAELLSIVNNWPKTVVGYNSLDISRERSAMDMSVVVESRNQVILAALQQLRGFVPSFSNELDDKVFSLALGLDVDNLASSLSKVWQDLQTPEYQCAPLAQMQAEISEQNPSMLGMMTGMVQGVKGVSFTVSDYLLSTESGEPSISGLDALLSLSAEKPSVLVDMAKGFVPQLASMELVDGGEAVDVTELLMLPPQVKLNASLAIKGQHLLLYTGKGEQLANTLGQQALSNNGLFTLGADYGKLLSPLVTAIEQSGEEMPEELEMLKDYNMKVQMGLDITDKGIVLRSAMETKAL
ncbi:hypothetical protein [Shewanella sp. SR44-3]|uniref:hypothetical protein n=1 Tax=Shewanella sp. SR44-3 TaxID=2760936 RepID=UPI0015F7AC08|nr:hypothetical protein [Shewanella sp. SR44-3]MBB1269535.1 hypothetical protein [Shewanella sp. SR44-3]